MVCSSVEGSGCVTVGVGRLGGRRVGVVERVGVRVPGRGVRAVVVEVRVGVLAAVGVVRLVERLVVVVPYPYAPGVASAGRPIPPIPLP